MEFSVHHQVLLAVLLVAIVLGAGMHKTRFCTMGGVSDWINMDHKGRLGAWFFAIAIAIGGVLILEAAGVLAIQNKTLGASFPPYRTAQFAWLRYLLGGLLFGVGMTLAGGCGSRTIVRVGSGSLKSLTVLIVASIVTYYMLWTELYQKLFLVWIAPTTINLARWGLPSQELGAVVGSFGLGSATLLHFILGGALVALVLFFTFRQRDFRSDWNNPLGGAVVGLAVVAGWFITGGPLSETWGEHALLASEPPIRVAAQSFTFVSPMGDAVNFLLGRRFSLVSFGLVSMVGVILGSALYALVSGKFRIERFASVADFVNHVIGAILLGVGGVLAMGCSIGQGVTGVSTLALGSIIALGAMIFGAAFTMKVQYYLLDDTGFLRALRLTVADLGLLPKPKAV